MPFGTQANPQTRAARLYTRVLSQWAGDSLRLRRAGLHIPTARRAVTDLLSPAPRPMRLPERDPRAEQALRWRAA